MKWKQDINMCKNQSGPDINLTKSRIIPSFLEQKKPSWLRNGRSMFSRIGICIRASNFIFLVCLELLLKSIWTSAIVWKEYFSRFLQWIFCKEVGLWWRWISMISMISRARVRSPDVMQPHRLTHQSYQDFREVQIKGKTSTDHCMVLERSVRQVNCLY